MRILMVHPHDIDSPLEPWTRRVRSFAQELVKNGHEVKLVYFSVLASEAANRHYRDGYEAIPFKRLFSPFFYIRTIFELMKLAGWADIIHFQKCHYYSALPAVIAAYVRGKPLHYDWDDWEEKIWRESSDKSAHSLLIGFSFKILERFVPLFSDTVSVSSRYLGELSNKFGVDKKNVFFAPVGADLAEFNPRVSGSRIRDKYNIKGSLVLYVGQLHGAQYIDIFIRAANIVAHKNPGATFMVVGGGFMERPLRDLACGLGIADKIIFTSSVPYREIPEYIAASDICVAPFKETEVTRCKSPLKIVEYMASGKPIVASNVGDVRWILGGVGVLVDAGSHIALAGGILRIFEDRPLAENLSRFVRQRAERAYNWPKIVSSLLAAYQRPYTA